MMLIHRILLYTANSYELLFDLDFSNDYAKEEIMAVIKSTQHELPPIIKVEFLNAPVCRLKVDEMYIALIPEKSELSPLDKSSLLKLTKEYANLCKTFLGNLTEQNVLTNIARLAELTDQIFVVGRIHLLNADRIRGFITTPYSEPSIQNISRMSSSVLGNTGFTMKLPLISHSKSHVNHNKVLTTCTHRAIEKTTSISAMENLRTGHTSTTSGDLYVDLIETVTLISDSSTDPVLNIHGSLNTNNTSSSPINVNFKFKNAEHLGSDLTFDRTADGSKFLTDQELIVNGAPVGQASLMTYNKQMNLKNSRPLFTLQAVRINNGGISGIKFLLQCNAPHGSTSMKTFIHFKLPAAFNQYKGAVSTLKKLPSQELHIKVPGNEELLKPNERELDSFHSDVDLIWSIPEIHGQVANELVVQFLPGRRKQNGASEVDLSSISLEQLDARMAFEISNFLASGTRLTGVRIDKHMSSNVKKWVRQLTASGSIYEICCKIHP